MNGQKPETGSEPAKKIDNFAVQPPAISLPKGGGAIRGMGEKFAANPVTGTGAMTVPIATSPGRSGFGPQLSLSYDSGSGNGPFGFGWSLSLPSITRKTDKGLPLYRDAVESDVYLLSGAEDLVPVLDDADRRHVDEALDPAYVVHRYRPRVEGLFARIERWTRRDTGVIHWRSISRDNVTSTYGVDPQSRIVDPDDPSRTFSWVLCRTQDDKGNVIVYEYVAEDDTGVDRRDSNEHNRTRAANRYLKRILYGNRTSRLARPDWEADGWLFEVVFDYDEDHLRDLPWDPTIPATEQHHRVECSAAPVRTWSARPDPFSTYRAGFEVRTHRRCRRVLMFHRFDELTVQTGGAPYLVRATEFDYGDLRYDAASSVETELAHQGSTRFASFVRSVRQSGYLLEPGTRSTYLRKSLPPLEFEYSKARIDDELRELDTADLENLPVGLDDKVYRWLDLDGEGLSGILTEQADTWFYKPNLGDGRFGPLRVVPTRPNVRLESGGQQLVDLSGDGQLDVVAFGGPTPGFYERTHREDWETFRAFEQIPELRWDEPNVRLVDLSGDGHADVLVTENEVFTWYRSRGEEGFDPAARVYHPADEERGPRLVLADGTQSIFLADMSGDGMSDLVRIRNGEVCYWPNLGYGRFGAKVTMDDAPWFDSPDQFDAQRIRLADIDGSGTNDIIYLHRDGVRIYFNQSGNRWTGARRLRVVPPVDGLTSVTTADLLGNGTACLVWSSPLPGHAARPLRYVDLMGSNKPHLLIRARDSLGLTTELTYAPSTKFYLEDKRAGTPWITKLPFTVHCLETVTVVDRWRGTRFSTSYSYHHGCFDGHEREFRGFGRIEQVDSEHYGTFLEANTASPYVTDDHQLYQPPVKTITWFHTGTMLDDRRVLSQYATEYFRHPGVHEHEIVEPDLATDDLTADEWGEALRACKGMPLRQEIYELDVDALEGGAHRAVTLFSTKNHRCHIRRLQRRGGNRHAVFLVTEAEAITYHYELDLRNPEHEADPRIAHDLNLNVDALGNVLQAVAAVYPRRGRHVDRDLPPAAADRIASVQREFHVAYRESRFTNGVDDADAYRLAVSCEETRFELIGIGPVPGSDLLTCEQLRTLRLSDFHQPSDAGLVEVLDLPYHRFPDAAGPQKRIIERTRALYYDAALTTPLPFGTLGPLALPYESYRLALTDELLSAVFSAEQLNTARADLQTPTISGYLNGSVLADRFDDATGQYWIASGISVYRDNAVSQFCVAERYVDAFGNPTTLSVDSDYHMFLESSRDALDNVTRVRLFDHRVLAPTVIEDINGNLTEVTYDILGLPAGVAARGKGDGSEGDDLAAIRADIQLLEPAIARIAEVFTGSYDEPVLRRLLATASARQLCWFGETVDPNNGTLSYGGSPAAACSIRRETHVADLSTGTASPIQVSFEYSDGDGGVLARKVQAEPSHESSALRWLTSGRTVVNNKGKAVKQFEAYFSANEHRFEEPAEVGITPIVCFYDAVGRAVRNDYPDGTFSRVVFSPWHVTTYDANDTVLEPGNEWYRTRHSLPESDPRRRAADQAAAHSGTPTTTFVDSLGREAMGLVHNRYEDRRGVLHDERHLTFRKMDAEGRALWIRDTRDNLVMQFITPVKPASMADEPDRSRIEDTPAGATPGYDIAGNMLFQHSMDAGPRWTLSDAAGQPLYSWDTNVRLTDSGEQLVEQRTFSAVYDVARRPIEHRLKIDRGEWMVVGRLRYGESMSSVEEARSRNLRGQVYEHYDSSGVLTNQSFDLHGNLQESSRRLTNLVGEAHLDWSAESPENLLETEEFRRYEDHDALSRVIRLFGWHREAEHIVVYEMEYNARGLLSRQRVFTNAQRGASGERIGGREIVALDEARYDERGQRLNAVLGNGTIVQHDYDPITFRVAQVRTTRPGYNPAFPDHASSLADEGVLQQLYYTYDAVGNVTQIHDDAYEPVFFRNQRIVPESRFVYDAQYRLARASGRESATSESSSGPGAVVPATEHTFPITDQTLRRYDEYYTYDRAGNLLELAHVAEGGSWTRASSYAHDSNRLLASERSNGTASTARCHYDLHGNILGMGDPSEFHLRWDYRGMVRSVELGGGGQAKYSYDSEKRRTRKRIVNRGRVRWERLYLGGAEIYRAYGVDGEVEEEIETHHLVVDGERLLIIDDVRVTADRQLGIGTLRRYQYSNHLGSATLELDGDREIVSYEEFHPFGTSAFRATGSGIRATRKRYRYTGMERDEETGFAYHGDRYYLPWLGRWASVDPAGLAGGLNLYAYAMNNPIVYVDRTGNIAVAVVVVLALAIVAAGAIFAAPARAPDRPPTQAESEAQRNREIGAWAGNTLYVAVAAASLPSAVVSVQAWLYANVFGNLGRLGLAYAATEFTVGVVDPNPMGSLELPGPLDNLGRSARQAAQPLDQVLTQTVRATDDQIARRATRYAEQFDAPPSVPDVAGPLADAGADIAVASIGRPQSLEHMLDPGEQVMEIGARATEEMMAALASRGSGRTEVFYGSTDLSLLAQMFRVLTDNLRNRNVAVVEYVQDGFVHYLVMQSGRPGHTERRLLNAIDARGIDRSAVTRIYTEFEPCSLNGHQCGRLLRDAVPNASVSFSWVYGAGGGPDAAELRELGRALRRSDLGELRRAFPNN